MSRTAWVSPRAAAAGGASGRTRASDVAGAQPGGETDSGGFIGDVQATSQPQSSVASQPQSFQAGASQQQNGAGAGAKRWKKKFRDRDRQRPGDSNGASAAPQQAGFSNGATNSNGGGYRDRDTHQPGE